MINYILRRLLYMIPTLLIVSIISFIVMEAPPGDFVTTLIIQMEERGNRIDQETVSALRARYGVDKPLYTRYFKWITNLMQGNLGVSMQWNKPVMELIMQRLPWSVLISGLAFLIVYAIGIPIGVLSATRQYSLADYLFTFIGFIGICIPPFLLALLILFIYFANTGQVIVGLFSQEFQGAAWSWAKLADLLKHVWVPALIVGTAGTAGLIRVVRANMLDELQKPYVQAAKSRGLSRRRVIYKYPFRIALNPIVSTIGWQLPRLVEGELLASIVLGIPTLSPIFLQALLQQDMYMAGSIVFILTLLTLVGTLISDLLLAWVDPRIRHTK